MKIHIYYGGRGLVDDPTIFVINRMDAVLKELNVNVERFNLYEMKNTIATLPQTLKDADGIVLATTVEWHGVGGYMQQFLDACWLYGDKEKISELYMCPVVMATTYGEREGKLHLSSAWEVLGGRPCSGICGYIADTVSLEMNENYHRLIDKKAENLYRTINQKVTGFPASNQAVRQRVCQPKDMSLTPQEAEQLSQYISDDHYVKKQKEDIQELTSLFREKLDKSDADDTTAYVEDFRSHFQPLAGFSASYCFHIEGRKKNLILQISNADFTCEYGELDNADMDIQIDNNVMNEIVSGRMTFQRAFMGGSMKMKGDFKILRTLDQLFDFA
ncbi:MAG: SCP2 sterol-binding domain-containing protein [Lachnospiraceae bacterium]|nr:SCP2 sterol-binding domain-containing protein [Lachnospiraceae bacterium]MDE7239460.1 SCP2 sterol-binding domain-containing protein [Lachnospiraceae bacterium]